MSVPGDLLAQRYTLLREASRTSRGAIWQAKDATLDRRVHVLILDPDIAADRAQRRAFVDEAAQRAAVSDPYLAAIYDIGTDPPFVVFEDPGGGRLAERLRTGPLDAQLAARVAANVARSVQSLERRGDPVPSITSANVLLSSDGRGKLIPFITASATDDPRKDLAALTVLMLTGDEPVDGKVPRREVPSPLADLLSDMLSKDPSRAPTLDEFVDACAALTRPTPVRAERRRMRAANGDLGWLLGVVTIVLLAVAAVMLGPSLLSDLEEDPTSSPNPSATQTSTDTGSVIEVADISDFDPPPGNGEEHATQVGRVLDGDPLTAWSTLGYASASMAPKEGVGLLLDLGTVTNIASMRVQTSQPGWQAEIRVSDVEPTDQNDLDVATSFTAGSDTTVPLPKGTAARYVLVWLTKLIDDTGESDFPFRGSIAELELFA
jgi:hypothetical protein